MQDQRIKALDGVRGTACLLVLVGHYVYDPLVPELGTWLSYFQRLLAVSTTGVDLFFVLSGFLLGGIILDNLRAINLLRVFYVRRALRIFPLYFAWVFSYFAIVSLCDGHRFKRLWKDSAILELYFICAKFCHGRNKTIPVHRR